MSQKNEMWYETMSKLLYLSTLINVFNVVPTFLLPVFSDGSQFYFQVLKNDTIDCFEEADLSNFSACRSYDIVEQKTFMPKSSAIYAIDMPDGSFIYGDSDFIATNYFKNRSSFEKYPEFVDSMERFLQEIGVTSPRLFADKGRALIATHTALDFTESYRQALMASMYRLLNDYKTNLEVECFFPPYTSAMSTADSMVPISRRRELHQDLMFSVHELLHDYFGTTHLEMEILSDSRQILIGKIEPIRSIKNWFKPNKVTREFFENSRFAVYQPIESMSRANDIFAFRRFLKSSGPEFSIKYYKSPNELSVEEQIKILDILLEYPPKEYGKYIMHLESSNMLWNEDDVYKIYCLRCVPSSKFSNWQQHIWEGKKDILKQLKHWGIFIDTPKARDDDLNEDNVGAFWATQLPFIMEKAEAESSRVFWFEIKTLSEKTYAIIAQDYITKKRHFCIEEKNISGETIINFIDALNHDIDNKKAILLCLKQSNYSCLFDEQLSNWLSENEEKCTVWDVPHRTQYRF